MASANFVERAVSIFIATHFIKPERFSYRYAAYGMMIKSPSEAFEHWGQIREAQPVDLEMLALKRVLFKLAEPDGIDEGPQSIRLKVFTKSGYLGDYVTNLKRRKRRKEKGAKLKSLRNYSEVWDEVLALWMLHDVRDREARTASEKSFLSRAKNLAKAKAKEAPSVAIVRDGTLAEDQEPIMLE